MVVFTITEDITNITYDEDYQIVEYKNGKIKKYKLPIHMPSLTVAAILFKSSFGVELKEDRTYQLKEVPNLLKKVNKIDLANGYTKFVFWKKKFVDFSDETRILDSEVLCEILAKDSILA